MRVRAGEGLESEASNLDDRGDGLRRVFDHSANDGRGFAVDGIDDERYLETIVEGSLIDSPIGEVSESMSGRSVTEPKRFSRVVGKNGRIDLQGREPFALVYR